MKYFCRCPAGVPNRSGRDQKDQKEKVLPVDLCAQSFATSSGARISPMKHTSYRTVPRPVTLRLRALLAPVYLVRGCLLVMTAVKNGLTLVAVAEGPMIRFTPRTSAHPSAVNMTIAQLMGNSVNSFTWNRTASQ
jgi:hypothetical protein